MRFNGILAVNFKTPDINLSQVWLRDYVRYAYKLFDFYGHFFGEDNKSTILINKNGGLPLVLAQDFGLSDYWFNDLVIGDLGVLAFKVRVPNLRKVYLLFKNNKIPIASKLLKTYDDKEVFWMKDPYGNNYIFQQKSNKDFFSTDELVGGVYGVVIGVKDLNKAIDFYTELGYKVKQKSNFLYDLEPLNVLGTKFNRVILTNKNTDFLLYKFLGPTEIDLVCVPEKLNSKQSPFNLVFLSDQTHKISLDLQFQAIDEDNFTVLFSKYDDPVNQTRHYIVDIFRLRLKNIWDWDLKEAQRKNKKFTINFVLNNALEKI
jgi:catechol 2,3-dioxygenase-like lactoylglutathione lyase family enzyme